MPFVRRYSDVKKGGIVFTGNTLGLSKAAGATAPGTEGSIGAFTSTDETLKVGAFPAGTTLDYTRNGSRATLTLPAGSGILYAELVWGGLYRSSANNISNLIGNSIGFATPSGTYTVSPDPATAQNFTIPVEGLTLGFYVRSADVTSLVQSGGGGSYTVRGVPALIEATDSRTASTNHAGWTLAVVYEDNTLPLRNLTIWSGGTVVSPASGSTTITIDDFLTPETQPVSGRLFVSAQEGDAVLTGDRMLFGPNAGSLSELSGPNNPAGNFFASQINGPDGTLDTSGTFGTRNANAASGTNTIACRQGWDIAAIDIDDRLNADQSSAVIRFTSSGDLYVPNALGLQIDSKGANLELSKTADRAFANVGEEIGYAVSLKNTGGVSALNVVLSDLLPPETELVAGSVTVDGAPYAGPLPVAIAEIPAGETSEVAFRVTANALPALNPVINVAHADYEFFPFAGYPASSSSDSNPESVYILSKSAEIVKSVNAAYAIKGDFLTYTSVIRNAGNIPMTDVFFTDAVPAGTTFEENSVYIDGIHYPGHRPDVGFFTKNLAPQQSTEVLFRVQVN